MKRLINNKLAIFLPDLTGGGAGKVFVLLANKFIQNGYDVDFILGRAKGVYLSELDKKVLIYDLKSDRMRQVLFPLCRYLKDVNPDVVLSGLLEPNVLIVLAKYLTGSKCFIVTTIHNAISLEFAVEKLKWIKKIIYAYFLKRSNSIVVVSKGAANDLASYLDIPKEKIKIIYNPVIPKNIKTLCNERINDTWFKTKESRIVLAVGRLLDQKDFKTLIKAFDLVVKKINVNLVIIGEGEKRAELEGLVEKLDLKNRVFMPGLVANPFKYMKKASLLVLSSRYEGFANVIAEALACGTPVVSTNCPFGPSEILGDGKYGTLVPVGDYETMALKIIESLKTKHTKQKINNHLKEFEVHTAYREYLKAMNL